MRDGLDLAAQLVRHRAGVVAEALVERALEPLGAAGVGEQAVDPGAERGDQLGGGAGFGGHVTSVARRARCFHAAGRGRSHALGAAGEPVRRAGPKLSFWYSAPVVGCPRLV